MNIFSDIPADLSEEVFEILAKSEQVKIERIISKGHNSPKSGWYDQAHHEWVIILKGSAILSFDDKADVCLKPGDYCDIKAGQKHKVTWTEQDKETIWLAVHY